MAVNTWKNFVLYPIKEILPTWKHPATNESIDILISKLPDEDKKSILLVVPNYDLTSQTSVQRVQD